MKVRLARRKTKDPVVSHFVNLVDFSSSVISNRFFFLFPLWLNRKGARERKGEKAYRR